MPDDNNVDTGVAEQVDTPVEETLRDETAAFNDNSDDREDDFSETPETDEEEPGGEADEEEPEAPDSEEEAEETDEEETDEDVERGKAILAEQEKAEADRLAAEQQQQQQAPGGEVTPFNVSHTPEDVNIIANAIPKNLLPDKVTLPDGRELDFKGYMDADPEAAIVSAAIANNIIQHWVANGQLAPGNIKDEIHSTLKTELFMRTLTNKNYGVPNVKEIHNSPEFKEWLPKQAPEIQALFRSNDPFDRIRGYKRFIGMKGKDAADKNLAERDGKRKKSKAAFDSVHKSTPRKPQTRPGKSALTPEQEEDLGFKD